MERFVSNREDRSIGRVSMARRLVGVTALGVAAVLGLAGCQASPWKENFAPTGDAAATLAPTAAVELRQVPWERLQAFLQQMEAENARSDVNPADWPAEKRLATKAALLRALQVSEDPATVDVLGRSDFRTTDRISPDAADAADLQKVAREFGADRVVWSRRFVGKSETIVQEPITSYSSGTAWGTGNRKNNNRSVYYSESSTTWVPLRITADEYAYVAYFLRVR